MLSDQEQCQAEEVAAVFRTVVIGVVSAAIAAIVLAIVLDRLGIASSGKVWGFSLYISTCAFAHIMLWAAHGRRDRRDAWQLWGRAFAVIAIFEGLGWGWSPVAFADTYDGELLCLLVTIGISAGAVTAFGAYRPAFFGFFLCATLPYVAHVSLAARPIQRGEGVLMVLFVFGICAYGVIANRAFRRLVFLRLEAERLAAQLEAQVAVTEAASRAKSSFLAAASHDLRQPVHALSLLVGALEEMALPGQARRVVERIGVSTQALDGLFAALLDISRLDADVVDVERHPFAIAPMLERVVADHRAEAEAKGLTLVLHRSSIVVLSDPIHVERILRNLLANAVRYTASGRIVMGCRRGKGAVRVEVWDTGLGIKASQRERIFEEYYQVGNHERDRAKGLGLGLAIVRRLAKLLESPLTLRSVEGRGSCFAIELPVSSKPLPPVERQEAADLQGHHTIVVVDDEAEIRIATTILLSRWGKTVVAAGSGAEALEQLASCPVRPDLMICDFRLRDGETGLDVVRLLRSEYNEDIPAILITGETAPERLVDADASGLLVLHKPISNSRLHAAIANVLSNNVLSNTIVSDQAG